MAENNNNNHGSDNEANAALSPAIQLLPDTAMSSLEWNKARGLEDGIVLVTPNPEDIPTAAEEMAKKHGVDSVHVIFVPNRNSNSRQQPTVSGGQDGATVPVQGNDKQNK
ncbi:hypothetical protein ACCO45_013520 [Purpureocillium lilacinum]|uniref:Uncharacterized protein n=1 Tax=Purpureocillium lilacinum TaxID=33203 RepID=A0ACC4D966_PURLI